MAAGLSIGDPDRLRTTYANVSILRALETIAARFQGLGIPLMALKGAALNLTIFEHPGQRPMSDLDLMVKPEDVSRAVAALTALGCRPGRPLVRADFFPRFHYETEFLIGRIFPVRVDLHVRPLRLLRYARLIPAGALWEGAETVRVGRAEVFVPSAEDMLIHLAAHCAIHAHERPMWLADLKHWAEAWGGTINWQRFLAHARAWGLVLPVRQALARAEQDCGAILPPEIRASLDDERPGWRDRLALAQAPQDATRPAYHVLVNVLCTPGWRFVLSYLRAAAFPDRRHMGEWYDHRHAGWLFCAHLLRILSPFWRRSPRLARAFSRIEVREGSLSGPGVFATRVIRAGERIVRVNGAPPRAGSGRRRSVGSKLDYLHHSCGPNTKLHGNELRALRVIDVGEEMTRDYGEHACTCRRRRLEPVAPVMSA